jgi:hypothetical protein
MAKPASLWLLAECFQYGYRRSSSGKTWTAILDGTPFLGGGFRSEHMAEWSPLEDGVLLKGTLRVIVRNRRDGQPRVGQRVAVRGCGFV